MPSPYNLTLVPADGPTLAKRTNDEWDRGYKFRVVDTNCGSFRRGERINITQVDELVDYQHLSFNITFETESVKEHFTNQADDCYASEQVLENWKLFTGGQ